MKKSTDLQSARPGGVAVDFVLSWDEDDNGPVIPRRIVPGPRRSPEAVTV